jgi:hypothetical protein
VTTVQLFSVIKTGEFERKIYSLSTYDWLAITLVDGSILLGGLSKQQSWDGTGLALSFNASAGRRFGNSWFIYIPVELIADLSVVPLNKSNDLEFLTPQDYPNPLASIVSEHNELIAALYNLEIMGYVEKAFAQDAVPPEGYNLTDNFLLYADWDFFIKYLKGETSITASPVPGVIGISKNVKSSLEEVVMLHLNVSLSTKVNQKLSPKIGNYITLQGAILVPDNVQSDVIEGDECVLFKLATTDGIVYPLILKTNQIKLPVNFLSGLNSVLTCYGEIISIPLTIAGEKFQSAFFLRAAAYLT